eukprot:TRINITY_DN5516_c1_g1_i1.p1 TRINITY_DN5516_c1_g1~~TRINITY_DN5516_c1_g1_i1.p1  ORF type:complete len:342 (-),score=86.79 TRINITY_DN5516_c1_g1_i1:177-1202(-)
MLMSEQKTKSKQFPRSLDPAFRPQMRSSIILTEPEYLLEGYVEIDVFVLGEITGVPLTVDISNRMAILPIIDDARKKKKIPWKAQAKHRSTVSLSAYNIKLISQKGVVITRIPIHEIAGMSYIRDDDEHILVIKRGDPKDKECSLIVMSCTKMSEAEEICTILEQIFQLVYTEATMAHLDDAIDAGAEHKPELPPFIEPVRQRKEPNPVDKLYGHETAEMPVIVERESTVVPMEEDTKSQHRDSTDQDLNVVAEEIVQQYMERLHSLLAPDELMQFALLLRQYRSGMTINEFCDKLVSLYSKKRYFLLPDMRSFIPEEDKIFFEAFLVECGQGDKARPMGK